MLKSIIGNSKSIIGSGLTLSGFSLMISLTFLMYMVAISFQSKILGCRNLIGHVINTVEVLDCTTS